MCCHSLSLEERSTSYVTILGKDSWKLAAGFPRTLPYAPFPFAGFALCHSTAINLSRKHNCMLSPVSPLSKPLNLAPATQLVWPVLSFLPSSVHLVKALQNLPLPLLLQAPTGFQCRPTTSGRSPPAEEGWWFVGEVPSCCEDTWFLFLVPSVCSAISYSIWSNSQPP